MRGRVRRAQGGIVRLALLSVLAVVSAPVGVWAQVPGQGATRNVVEVIRTESGTRDLVRSLAYSPDGRWLAGGSWDRTVRVWDAGSGALVRTLTGHTGAVYSVVYSPDGRWLASGSDDKTVRVWDAGSGALVRTLTGHDGWVRTVTFSADGRWLASGSDDRTVRVWDARSGALVRTLTGHFSSVYSVVYSPDGRRLASGSADQAVRVWDAATGALLRTRTGHAGGVLSLAYSADGRWLASGSADNTVRVWDAGSGALVRTLTGHDGYVSAVAYSADGRWLASGGGDNMVRVWDAGSGALVNSLAGHEKWVSTVVYSPDGRRLASGSADQTVRVWDQSRTLVMAQHPQLADRFQPQGEFETSAQYRARLEAAETELTRLVQVAERERAEEQAQAVAKAFADAARAAAAREARIVASRRLITVPDRVVLERYNPDAGQYPVLVGGVRALVRIPLDEAQLLSQNRDRIVIEAVEQLDASLTRTERVNLQLVHPVTGRRYPVGPQVQLADAPVAVARVTAPAALEIIEPKFTDTDGDNRLGAGERAVLEFRLRNTGQGPAQGVRVMGTSSAPIDGLRASLGTIEPGATRAVTLTLTGGADVQDTMAVVALEVKEVNGFDAPPLEVRVRTRAFRPPVLQVADVGVEDAEGRAEIRSGRVVTLTIRVRNGGEGPAVGVIAEIAAGANVLLVDSTDNRRVSRRVGDLAPGAHRDIQVQAFANAQAGRTFPVTVALRERSGRFTADARDLGLTQETPQRTVAQLEVAAREGASAPGSAAAPGLVSDLLPIPTARTRNRHAIAVIIGNRSYRNAPGVAFAANDAAVMRQYAERALGVSPENIVELIDATGTELNATFGMRGNPNGRLRDLVTVDSSDVFVFYSGHGAPDARAQRAYLMPVDADADRLDLTAYSVDVLYENLAALGARHVTVVLDACFSGATGGGEMLITAASPIGIQVNDPSARFAAGSGATIIAAAQGQELANWYPEQRHGMLTYFFLKGLQGSADADGDGMVTVGEMRSWLTDPASGVPSQSRRLFGMNRQQTPQVWGAAGRVMR